MLAHKVRRAEPEDFARMVEMGAAMQMESPRFSRFGYSKTKAMQLLWALSSSEDCIALAAEVDGEVVGMMLGYVSEHFFSTTKIASELLVYVAPKQRGGRTVVRMIHAFEDWAKSRGADEILLGVSTEVHYERTTKLYDRLGFRTSGSLCAKSMRD